MNEMPKGGILGKMPTKEKFRLLGEVSMLMMQSQLHCSYFIGDMYECILPPIDLNQFRIYYKKGGYPIGFVCWAFLSEDKEQAYLKGEYSVQIADWNSGDKLIFTEFIAPFGNVKNIIKDLTYNIFPNKIGKSVKMKQKRKIESIKTFYGKNVKRTINANNS
jgi:cytolysin-activating lysine-acyltransferase